MDIQNAMFMPYVLHACALTVSQCICKHVCKHIYAFLSVVYVWVHVCVVCVHMRVSVCLCVCVCARMACV